MLWLKLLLGVFLYLRVWEGAPSLEKHDRARKNAWYVSNYGSPPLLITPSTGSMPHFKAAFAMLVRENNHGWNRNATSTRKRPVDGICDLVPTFLSHRRLLIPFRTKPPPTKRIDPPTWLRKVYWKHTITCFRHNFWQGFNICVCAPMIPTLYFCFFLQVCKRICTLLPPTSPTFKFCTEINCENLLWLTKTSTSHVLHQRARNVLFSSWK